MRSPISDELLPWLSVIRRLRAAGWEYQQLGAFGAADHIWTRNRHALNEQRITWNLSGAMLHINGRTVTAVELCPAECRVVLRMLGAFRPAPERVDRDDPFTREQRRRTRDLVLARAANDPAVSDDVFAVLAPAIERRPI